MIKDIAIHLTGSAEDKVRIVHAAGIARVFDAHLTGLQVHELPEVLSITDPSGSAFLRELVAQSLQRAESVGAALEAEFAKAGVVHQLKRLEVYPGQAGAELAREVRASDIFLGTRPYGDAFGQEWIEEAVLFQSGRPCLFLPPGYAGPDTYRSIFIAWKNTQQAARAVTDALPFLKKAKSVVVGIVDERGASEQLGKAPDEDIGRYLSRHGIKAEVHTISGWTDVSAALLNEAVRTASDLVVMGAYGHSRFREWVLGGATRHLLSKATMPVLVAH